MKSKIGKKVRKDNAKKIAKYYGSLGRPHSVFVKGGRSVLVDKTKGPMFQPDTRKFRGEKVTPEEIADWAIQHGIKSYNAGGVQIS